METPRDLLRFLTCGSVDDGKSTLIGRLLHDSRCIMDDTLASLAQDSRKHGTTGEETDLALLLDGLEAEREQGITIDVAYRFFATPARSFIVADTPGHEQFTRNMATGASNCDLAILLVDARKGLFTQTRRHATICARLGIRQIVLAVNKIDLVDFSQSVFDEIVRDFRAFAARLGALDITAIPVSARFGDNVALRSPRMPWHAGPSLLEHLETVEVEGQADSLPFRLPVQWVNRPNLDFRGFAGTVASGRIALGAAVVVLPSGQASRVTGILGPAGPQEEARAGEAVTLRLADEIDIARGDVLASPETQPAVADQFAAHVIWMDDAPLLPGRGYLLRIGHNWVPATVSLIKHRLDVEDLGEVPARQLAASEIGVCNLSLGRAMAFDPYAENRAMGGFILVDRFSNRTVGAGTIDFALRRAGNIHPEAFQVTKAARAALGQQKPTVIWFTGLSGSGKSTIANLVEAELHRQGRHTTTLDGDNLRHGLNRDLGFTAADRVENIRRVGEVAKLMTEAGLIVLCAFISPFRAERQMVRELLEPGEFLEVFVDTSLAECRRRDPKGLYAKADAGLIRNFTGLDSPYEAPEAADLHLRPEGQPPEAMAAEVIAALRAAGRLG